MSTIDFSNIEPQKVSRFGHHPDPIVDWEVEVECLESGRLDRELGLAEEVGDTTSYGWDMLVERIGPALEFGASLPRDEGNVAANYLKLKHIDGWLLSNRWRRTMPEVLTGIPESIRMQTDTTNRLYRHGKSEQSVIVNLASDEDVIETLQKKRRVIDEQLVAMEAKRNWIAPQWTMLDDDASLVWFMVAVFLFGAGAGVVAMWFVR